MAGSYYTMSECNFLFMPWLYWIMKNVWARSLNCSFSCLTSTSSRQNNADIWPVLWWLRQHNLNWIEWQKETTTRRAGDQTHQGVIIQKMMAAMSDMSHLRQVTSPYRTDWELLHVPVTYQSSKSDGWLQRSVAQSLTLQRQLAWNVHTSVWKHFLTPAACKQLVKLFILYLFIFFYTTVP